jgi:hypothetical protein
MQTYRDRGNFGHKTQNKGKQNKSNKNLISKIMVIGVEMT